ncbi:MAG: cell division protein FtsW [Candidatus Doudnabacteria bacterium RIFCSPHIGHO2_02_FULL_46_11]|uniref:Probable peptidoglycan glycosyltransferase FtsW n=1 Tax=Candidatus Doudnabacteria bacterium RIFCSPHIGHO2_02_FULL_46_11 TaxID=1817832 RepID=A0A1F5P475_9BACT|nr:MAG: cell division protein FtsW [Candidatus Doudnabacteria bacterium RIFCSPHIGHO2_02_FULL_46_11]
MIKSSKKSKLNPPNYTLLGLTLGLIFFGITAIASASSVVSWNNQGNTYYYLVHQILFGVFPGLLLMVFFSKINYRFWQKIAPLLIVLVLILLLAVLIPGIGVEIGGARRWLDLGFTYVQPSEIAKLVLIIYLAAWFDKRHRNLSDFMTGFLPSLVMAGVVAFLIYLQPDMGTLIVLTITAAAMFFTAGSQIKHLLGTSALVLVALFLAIKTAPYRAARIITFLDPSHDPQGIGYHVNQALLAVGSGGLLGYGYNNSVQKYNYLPEPMGDSIFAIIAEELGFIRVTLLMLLFVAFIWTGLNIAKRTPDNFAKLLAVGITTWIGIQAMINIGAMVAIMPLTGIPLPFISYGSSSLIAVLAATGILLNISRQETKAKQV